MEQRLIDANALHYHMGVNQNDKQIFYITGEDVVQDGPCGWSGKCSACKVRNDIPPVMLAHYCPNCGAKMEG